MGTMTAVYQRRTERRTDRRTINETRAHGRRQRPLNNGTMPALSQRRVANSHPSILRTPPQSPLSSAVAGGDARPRGKSFTSLSHLVSRSARTPHINQTLLDTAYTSPGTARCPLPARPSSSGSDMQVVWVRVRAVSSVTKTRPYNYLSTTLVVT